MTPGRTECAAPSSDGAVAVRADQLGSAGPLRRHLNRLPDLAFSFGVRRALPGYLLAILLVAVSLGVRLLLSPWMRAHANFFVFTPAVMLSAWYGGFGPGLLCTLVSTAVADYFLIEPVGQFTNSPDDLPTVTVFLFSGIVISWLSGALRTARYRAEADAQAARRSEQLLAVAREQLQSAHDELEMRVHQRTAELAFQKTLLEAQSNASLDGILAVAEDGAIIYCNHRMEELWGIAEESFGSGLEALIPAMRAKLVDRQNPLSEVERPQIRADGEPPLNLILTDGRTLECYSAPIRSADGREYGWVWFFRDITERKRLSKQILEAGELERQRIGQDLHDDLCQQLTGITFLGRVLQQRLAARLPDEVENAAQVVEMTEKAIGRARELAAGLQPVELRSGLGSALLELTGNVQRIFGVSCHFRGELAVHLPDPAAPIHLYRIAQEAMHNAIRHGKARSIFVDLVQVGSRVILTIEDDGMGIDFAMSGQGLGLRTMRHRARMIGATLAIERGSDTGTVVRCQLSKVADPGGTQEG